MKKPLFLFVFALTATALHAQNEDMYSLMFHEMTDLDCNVENFMRQRDGDFLFATFVATPGVSYTNPGTPLGNIFYKVSPSTLTITDSLFVENPDAPYYFFAPNPHGEGNIRANFEYDEVTDSTFLRICHFPDNDLNINHDDDIVVPVCEGYAFGEADNNLVDSRGDLIWKYYKDLLNGEYEGHVIRFSPDGSLKQDVEIPEAQNFTYKFREFAESPLQYYHWKGYNDENLAVFVLDSVFHTKYFSVINKILSQDSVGPGSYAYEHLEFNVDTEVVPVGGNDILVAARYVSDTNFYPVNGEYGVAVAKYDVRTMQQKGFLVFNDYPGYYREGRCMGLKKMTDGTVYFLYKENGYPNESVIIVKMDTNLNMEWKRFCKTKETSLSSPLKICPILVEDEQGEEKGIAWAGGGWETDVDNMGWVYFFLKHDGTVGVNESGIEVRPYCYYPNPAKDQLHMQFSPDVQPTRVELYDLQGRRVHAQRSAFESIDISRLSAGTYTMRVILKDGQAYSDKVVKE